MAEPLVLVGEIGRPHGVRGLVHLRSFCAAPGDIALYGPLTDEAGRGFAIEWLGNGLARIEGVADRDAAARLTGTRLYVPRGRLPQPEEEEFYLADLIGLAAFDAAGAPLGVVRAVEDFGAGAFLTVQGEGADLLVPFTRAAVPLVDLAARRVVLAPPEEVMVRPEEAEQLGLAPEDPPPSPRPRRGVDAARPREAGRRAMGRGR
jgi:16S rRNA processing protein RimM